MYFNVFGEKVSKRRYKEMCEAAKNRRELIAAGLTSRRDLFKMGLLTAGGMLVAKSGLSARAQTQTNQPPSSGGNNTSPGTNQTVWCFDDNSGAGPRSPGPTYQAFYGKPQLTRNINSLPNVNQVNNTGFGMPSVSTHLHNAHKPSESDGTRATSI